MYGFNGPHAAGGWSREYLNGNAFLTLPDGVTTRQDRNGGTMAVQVLGRDVRYVFDATEMLNRGIAAPEEALS